MSEFSFSRENSATSLQSKTTTHETDVIVIGGGLSGLTSAYRMIDKDPSLNVKVLEAKDSVGGRTLTVPLKTAGMKTDHFDLGGQFLCSSQPNISHLLEELSLSTYSQYSEGYHVGQVGHPQIYKHKNSFPLFGSWYCRHELQRFIERINFLSQRKTITATHLHNSYQLDSMTMETFICENLRTNTARDIFRVIIRTSFGMEANEVSVLFYLHMINLSGKSIQELLSFKDGGHELRIKGGAQQVSLMLAVRIGKNNIVLNDPVSKVEELPKEVCVTTKSGKVYKCEYLIVAIPPAEISKITFVPELPLQKRLMLQRYSAGHVVKFVATYAKPFWREKGFSGHAMSSGGTSVEHLSDACPVAMTFDATTYRGHAAIDGYMSAHVGIQWAEKDVWFRKQSVLECLSKFWGNWALEPIDYIEKDWSQESYVGGCPSHGLSPGVMCWFQNMRNPVGRIYWAGTECAVHWCGTMEGAVQAGNRAAIEVLYELRPQVLTHADIESTEIPSVDTCEEPSEPPRQPSVFRWTIILPLVLLAMSWAAYSMRSRYWFMGTGRIA